jgi:CheY-like chemotaxis protein
LSGTSLCQPGIRETLQGNAMIWTSPTPKVPEPFRVLVVEDEYIIATDICLELAAEGFEVVGPAGTLDHAFALAATTADLDAAVLDVNIGGHPIFGVADILSSRRIPFVLASGYDQALLPARHRNVPKFEKPLILRDVVDALRCIRNGRAVAQR